MRTLLGDDGGVGEVVAGERVILVCPRVLFRMD